MDRRERMNQFTEEERNARIVEIEKKLAEKRELTDEDKLFMYDNLDYYHLLLHPFCVDEFFYRSFFQLQQMNARQEIYYEHLVKEWGREMEKTNHTGDLMQNVAKETREELKVFRGQYHIRSNAYGYREYLHARFRIHEWSKYRYLIINAYSNMKFRNTDIRCPSMEQRSYWMHIQ